MVLNKWTFYLCFSVIFLLGYVQPKGFYTIISPKQIHPHSVHNVSITTHDVDSEVIVRFEIKCKPYTGQNFTFSHLVTVPANSTKNINFRFDNLPNGKFNFTAKGITGLEFENWTRLLYVPKSILCFIQTDKRIYKPGSTVRYRIIVLNSDLKVIPKEEIGRVNVTVFNSNKLKIKELTNVELNDHGMFSNDIGLARNIDSGFWTIRVKAENSMEVFLEQFEVADYKLPNFKVQIDGPKWSTYNTRSIKTRVRANYNFGKPVTGNYTAFLSPEPFEGFPKQPIANKTGFINGSAIVEFLYKTDLHFQQKYDRQFIIDVTVQDALNGQQQSNSAEIGVYVYDYKIGFVDAPDYFKPGLNYIIRVRVSHHNDKPVTSEEKSAENVTIYYGFEYESSQNNQLNVSLNQYGEALGQIPIPKDASKLYVLAQYKDATIELPHILRERTKRNAFVLAKLLTEKPTVDEDVLVEVTSTHRMTKLTYLLVGKDSTVFANTVSVKNQTKIILKFAATPKMVPKCTLLVYYMTRNGFIASDAMDLRVEMKDNFKVKLTQKQVAPGEMVNITIRAPENSTVNILALDESVLFLKGNENDISKQSLQEKFRHFVTNENVKVQRRALEPEDRRQVNFKVFRDAGVVLFTNAVKIKKKNVLFQTIPNTNQFREPDQESDEEDDDDWAQISSKDILLKKKNFNIRKQFPETWLWWDVVKQNDRDMILTTKVPDTITKWIINGFSVDAVNGMSVLQRKVALTVIKPFFITMDLPISINRGEMLTIPVILHNYSNKSHEIDLIFHNSKKEFCFDTLSICTASYKVRVQMERNSELPLTFRITPYKIGQVTLKISTFSKDVLMDRIEKFLDVKPEGVTRYINHAYFVDLRKRNKFELLLEPTIPMNYIPDSLNIQVKMTKNIMQSSIENLDALVRLPQGCGEQNLLSFVPNVVVMDYMQNTGQKNDLLRMKSLKFLQQSYQRQLKFRHPNGAFSTFGKADEIGSIWLTSYVIRSINWAKRYITVDQKVQNRALKWLNATQQENGSWLEVGKTLRDSIEKHSFGENGTVASLTAFTLWTFLEHPKGMTKYNSTIERAISFINSNIDNVNDTYSIALTAFVLQSVGRDANNQYFNKLQEMNKYEFNEKVWWSSRNLPLEQQLLFSPSALDIEITSYALLASLSANQVQDSVPILKWLISHRNSNGGFKSSQDTIVGLFAMSKMAKEFRKLKNHLNFTVNNIPIQDFNSVKSLQINPDLSKLLVQVTGSGAGIIELSAKYNVMPPKKESTHDEYFTINPSVVPLMDDNLINVTVCTRFNSNSKFGANWWKRDTNMAIVEVKLPSGFKLDESSYGKLKLGTDHLQKLETEEDETKIVLYYDKLTRTKTCPHLIAFRSHEVGKCQDGVVKVYDYYDPETETLVKF